MTELIKAGSGKKKKKRRTLKSNLRLEKYSNSDIEKHFANRIRGSNLGKAEEILNDTFFKINVPMKILGGDYEENKASINTTANRISEILGTDFIRLDTVMDNLFKDQDIAKFNKYDTDYYLMSKIKEFPSIMVMMLTLPSDSYLDKKSINKGKLDDHGKAGLISNVSLNILFNKKPDEEKYSNGLLVVQTSNASNLQMRKKPKDGAPYSGNLDVPISHLLHIYRKNDKIDTSYQDGFFNILTLEQGLRKSIDKFGCDHKK